MSLFSLCSNKILECFNSQSHFEESKAQISKRTHQKNPSKKDLQSLIQQEYDNKKQSLKRKNIKRKNIGAVQQPIHPPLQKVKSAPQITINIRNSNIQRKIYKSPPQLPRTIFQYKSPKKPPLKGQGVRSPRKCEIKFNYFTRKTEEKFRVEQGDKSDYKYIREEEWSTIKQSTSPSQQQAPLKETQQRTCIKRVDSLQERIDKREKENPESVLEKIKNSNSNIDIFEGKYPQQQLQSNIQEGQRVSFVEKLQSDERKDIQMKKRKQNIGLKEYKSQKGGRSMGVIMKDLELAESIPDEEENEDSFSEVIERSFNEISDPNINPDNSKLPFISLREKGKEVELVNFMSGNLSTQRKSSIYELS